MNIENNENIGIIITTHGYNGIYVIQCIECYLRLLPNAFIILYVNESEDQKILSIKKDYPKIKYIYIDDQHKSGGLTNTWNKGIDLCIKNKCEIIILSNDDIFFDDSIYNIITEAYNCKKEDNKYFGPVTNNPGNQKGNQKAQYSLHPLNKNPYECKYKDSYLNINGFFMVFPIHVLINNMYDNTYYFNPKYPFGKNECEWFTRFRKKEGIPIIVPKTFIYHYKLAAWRNKEKNNTCIFTVNLGNYDGSRVLLENNTDLDNIYFTSDFEIKPDTSFYNCIQKNIMPFYINCEKYTQSNWWNIYKQAQRHIKTFPNDFLPHNYTKSLYLDGDRILTKKIYKKDIDKYLEKHDIVCFENPWRRGLNGTIKNEAKEILKNKFEIQENIDKIFDLIKQDGFKDDIGSTETSILIRNHENLKEFSKDWKDKIYICIRDQMSFDYLLWKHKIKFKRYKIRERPTKKMGHSNTKGRQHNIK
jgi:GT2 family glycosyltransferase